MVDVDNALIEEANLFFCAKTHENENENDDYNKDILMTSGTVPFLTPGRIFKNAWKLRTLKDTAYAVNNWLQEKNISNSSNSGINRVMVHNNPYDYAMMFYIYPQSLSCEPSAYLDENSLFLGWIFYKAYNETNAKIKNDALLFMDREVFDSKRYDIVSNKIMTVCD